MMHLVGADKLYHCFDLEIFDFKMTDQFQETDEIIGQGRALEAISFGICIKKEGYSLYAMGKLGSGKDRVAYDYL